MFNNKIFFIALLTAIYSTVSAMDPLKYLKHVTTTFVTLDKKKIKIPVDKINQTSFLKNYLENIDPKKLDELYGPQKTDQNDPITYNPNKKELTISLDPLLKKRFSPKSLQTFFHKDKKKLKKEKDLYEQIDLAIILGNEVELKKCIEKLANLFFNHKNLELFLKSKGPWHRLTQKIPSDIQNSAFKEILFPSKKTNKTIFKNEDEDIEDFIILPDNRIAALIHNNKENKKFIRIYDLNTNTFIKSFQIPRKKHTGKNKIFEAGINKFYVVKYAAEIRTNNDNQPTINISKVDIKTGKIETISIKGIHVPYSKVIPLPNKQLLLFNKYSINNKTNNFEITAFHDKHYYWKIKGMTISDMTLIYNGNVIYGWGNNLFEKKTNESNKYIFAKKNLTSEKKSFEESLFEPIEREIFESTFGKKIKSFKDKPEIKRLNTLNEKNIAIQYKHNEFSIINKEKIYNPKIKSYYETITKSIMLPHNNILLIRNPNKNEKKHFLTKYDLDNHKSTDIKKLDSPEHAIKYILLPNGDIAEVLKITKNNKLIYKIYEHKHKLTKQECIATIKPKDEIEKILTSPNGTILLLMGGTLKIVGTGTYDKLNFKQSLLVASLINMKKTQETAFLETTKIPRPFSFKKKFFGKETKQNKKIYNLANTLPKNHLDALQTLDIIDKPKGMTGVMQKIHKKQK